MARKEDTAPAGVQQGHLALWNAVVKTDPAYTKSFSRAGGFKGTAINFVYLARKATEMFGPIGIGWGHEVLDENFQPGALLVPAGDDGGPIYETVHVVRIKFWYELNGKRGEFESFGQTTFVGQNSKGIYTDEEAPKKSLTDALSKAMSWLGFGADVHLGLFDDNKYVNDRKAEFGPGKSATVDQAPPEHIRGLDDQSPSQGAPLNKPAAPKINTAQLAKAFRAAKTIDELRDVCSKAKAQCREAKDAASWAELSAVMDEVRATFGEGPKPTVTVKDKEHSTEAA